jgi:hypothetical protein
MREALDRAERVVGSLSAAYFDPARYTTDEWSAAMVKDSGGRPRLVPVRIEDVTPPRLLRPIMSADLFGVDAVERVRVCWARSVARRAGRSGSRIFLVARRLGG